MRAVAFVGVGLVVAATAQPRHHLTPPERGAVDSAALRAGHWLFENQRDDGSFEARVRSEICPVALTAVVTLGLAKTDAIPVDHPRLLTAVAFLQRHGQADGGIYSPRRGLAVYTSGVAAAALQALHARGCSAVDPDVAARAELFVVRREHPESFVDVEAKAGRLGPDVAELLKSEQLSPEQRRALEFLNGLPRDVDARPPARLRAPGTVEDDEGFGYEDLLPFVYRPIERTHRIVQAALASIRERYTLARNPDLTGRYGAGFQGRGAQGLYYYYVVLAKTLAVHEIPVIELADGSRHDWVRELWQRLSALAQDDGSWVNADSRWWEDEPVLTTAYVLMTLSDLADVPAPR